MKLLALALTLLVSACAQVVPIIDQKHNTATCCMLLVEPSKSSRLSLAVDPDPLSVKAKVTFKF
jgi:hypothetical protein